MLWRCRLFGHDWSRWAEEWGPPLEGSEETLTLVEGQPQRMTSSWLSLGEPTGYLFRGCLRPCGASERVPVHEKPLDSPAREG